MAQDKRLICGSADLVDAGSGFRFRVSYTGREADAFAVRFRGKVFGYINLSREFYRQMKSRGSGVIINILGNGGEAPDAGYIAMDGLDLRSWSLEGLREHVMLLRGHDIVNGTIIDNIRLGRTEIGLDEVNAALKSVDLLDEIMAMPEGLKTPLITGGLPLSSRQRTRLLLARALAMKPRLLLLDDIFDGLDRDSLRRLTAPVFAAERTRTLVIATRHPEVAAKCDRCIEMNPVETAPAH